MSQDLEVSIHLDPELCLPPTVKSLPSGSTIADLKELLAQDDPTGTMRVEDFALAPLAAGARPFQDQAAITWEMLDLIICAPWQDSPPAAAVEELAEVAPAEAALAEEEEWPYEEEELAEEAPAPCGPCEYRVVQGPLVKKPGTQGPAGSKIVKLNRKVGSTVRTTGQTWTGPAGGEWVELDGMVEKPGWLLIEGPGFDLPGPLLERAIPGEDPPIVLTLYSAISKTSFGEVLVRPSQTINVMKDWIVLRRRENVPQHKIWCTKATPEEADGKYFLKTLSIISTGTVLEQAGFVDGDTLVFVIINSDGEMA